MGYESLGLDVRRSAGKDSHPSSVDTNAFDFAGIC